MVPLPLPIFLVWSFMIVAFERSSHYSEAVVFTLVAVVVRAYMLVLPGLKGLRPVEQWASGHPIDRLGALDATYAYARRMATRAVGSDAVWSALFMVSVGAIAGASGWRLVQYAILGVASGVAAMLIHRLVAERFGGALRIGIGINTGTVIAGTIGGGGKLEFTLIGDPVNVAARVEQLTKSTGDTILLTDSCVDALATRPPGLVDRGSHALKGKSAAVQVFTLDPGMAHNPVGHH
jgi:class 3 adenylate cyclase